MVSRNPRAIRASRFVPASIRVEYIQGLNPIFVEVRPEYCRIGSNDGVTTIWFPILQFGGIVPCFYVSYVGHIVNSHFNCINSVVRGIFLQQIHSYLLESDVLSILTNTYVSEEGKCVYSVSATVQDDRFWFEYFDSFAQYFDVDVLHRKALVAVHGHLTEQELLNGSLDKQRIRSVRRPELWKSCVQQKDGRIHNLQVVYHLRESLKEEDAPYRWLPCESWWNQTNSNLYQCLHVDDGVDVILGQISRCLLIELKQYPLPVGDGVILVYCRQDFSVTCLAVHVGSFLCHTGCCTFDDVIGIVHVKYIDRKIYGNGWIFPPLERLGVFFQGYDLKEKYRIKKRPPIKTNLLTSFWNKTE